MLDKTAIQELCDLYNSRDFDFKYELGGTLENESEKHDDFSVSVDNGFACIVLH